MQQQYKHQERKRKNDVKFSIIIPVYNVEMYLRECVNSVLSQTVANFELILVDDGSKDSSGVICDEYSFEDERVVVIHKSNGGQADARNIGLEVAKGEYILFIDSDDYLSTTDVLSKISKQLVSDLDVVMFKHVKFYDNTKSKANCTYTLKVPNSISDTVDLLLYLINKDVYYNSPWSKCIRRELLVKNNITFEKGLLGEDNDWYYKVVEHATTYGLIDEVFIIYRQHSSSTTKNAKINNLQDMLYILEKWSIKASSLKDKNKLYLIILSSLAKQYCNTLIMYSLLKNAKKEFYWIRIINLSFLLQYSNNKRVIYFRMAKRLIGMKGIVSVIKFIKKFQYDISS